MAFENTGIGFVADGDEHAVQGYFLGSTTIGRCNPHSRHAAGVAQHFVERVVPFNGNLALCLPCKQPVLQDFLCL